MPDFNGVFEDILSRVSRIERRINSLEVSEYIRFYPILGATDYLIHTTINDGITYDSGSLRGVQGISEWAKGIVGTWWITPSVATLNVYVTPGNDTPGTYSQQYRWGATGIVNKFHTSQLLLVQLGPTGNILIKPVGANAEVFIVVHGYWG